MDLHGPGNSAYRARSNSISSGGLERRLAQLGMSGQTQVIVRCQVDDFLAVKSADRRLLVVEHAQLEVRAFGPELVELVSEIRERIGAGCSGHHQTSRRIGTDLHESKPIMSLIPGHLGRKTAV